MSGFRRVRDLADRSIRSIEDFAIGKPAIACESMNRDVHLVKKSS